MTDAPAVRTLDHASALGRWRSATRRPHPALGAVSFGYAGLGGVMNVRRELHLPSGAPAIVVNFGAPFRVMDLDGRETFRCDDVSFMGVHSQPFVTETADERDHLVLNLTPLGTRRMLGAPMDQLANRWVALADIAGAAARDLGARLRGAEGWGARFDILDGFMLTRVEAARRPSHDLAAAHHWMAAGGGAKELAQRVGVSHKHLIDLFHDQVGLAPKLVGRLARFNRLLRLGRAPIVDWAGAAQACGYFDQAHLINEVRDFAGASPTALEARRASFTLRAEPTG